MEQGITGSRNENWTFGVERIIKQPWFGEGMLTKQTQGGQSTVNMQQTSTNYNPIYDPHSLLLSLGVQGGLPFLFAVMLLILLPLFNYTRQVGMGRVLGAPEFVFCFVQLLSMIPAGGDLTSFGNVTDRIFWILLGSLSLKVALNDAPRKRQARRAYSRFMATAPGQWQDR
jgi:O-antigen ligase